MYFMENKTINAIGKIKNPLKRAFKSATKSAIRYALAGAIGLSSLISPIQKAHAINREQMLNPFVRPNVHSQAYYGSGDADENGVVNWDDVDFMKRGRVSDFTDVNGDGITDKQDISMLESYLNNEIPYLLGDWNKLQTLEEKDDWYTKMYKIDPLEKNSLKLINQGWKCGSFSMQALTNFFGIKKLMNGWEYLSNEYNGRFNLPVYMVDVGKKLEDGNSFAHRMNAILVGNDPLNFSHWRFSDTGNRNSNVDVGDFSLPENSTLVISGIYDEGLNGEGSSTFSDYLLMVRLEGKTPVVIWQNPQLKLTKPTIPDDPVSVQSQSPLEFKLSQNSPNPFNSGTIIPYTLEKPGKVSLDIYNNLGQRIETLVDGVYQNPGKYNVTWNPSGKYSSGVYHYRLNVDGKTRAGKMSLMK
jgi:hypothetical protein